MPFLLRKIDKKPRWWPLDDEINKWLSSDDVQADALAELQTSNNTLSVWLVQDDEANLSRILAALAANRDHPSDLHFVLLEVNTCEELGFEVHQTLGETIDQECNLQWHRDIVHLSAGKIGILAKQIHSLKTPQSRRRKEIKELLRQSILTGTIDKNKLNTTLLEDLDLK